MFGRFAKATTSLTTRRIEQTSALRRGFEEFFEKGQRLPVEQEITGRSWAASELRQKSWEDLHKLWYVVLKERNVLASQIEEASRLGIPSQFFSNKGRMIKCRKTMARIKFVLSERKNAWEKNNQIAAIAAKEAAAKLRAAKKQKTITPESTESSETTTAPVA